MNKLLRPSIARNHWACSRRVPNVLCRSLPASRIPTSSPPFSSTFGHATRPNRHNRGRRRCALNFLPRQTSTGSSSSQRPPEAACTSHQKPLSKFAPIALAAQTTPTHKSIPSIPSLNTHINWILSASRYFAFRSKSVFILLIPRQRPIR